MWSRTYSKKIHGLSINKVWNFWVSVNEWHTWQNDIEYAKLNGDFKVGNTITMQIKDGPNVSFEIVKLDNGKEFTDVTRFFGARMFDRHELIDHGNELEIRTTISVEGILSFLWRKIVAENVANGMEEQTNTLIERAKNNS